MEHYQFAFTKKGQIMFRQNLTPALRGIMRSRNDHPLVAVLVRCVSDQSFVINPIKKQQQDNVRQVTGKKSTARCPENMPENVLNLSETGDS